MNSIMKILVAVVVLHLPSVMQAVTTDEMEQARAVTAQCYLRYVNNGSGYLDELNPKNMAELEKDLKTKELENIKLFKQLAAFPPDYKSWNKEQLVKYWSETFFASPSVPAEAKKARPRVTRKLEAMEVSVPRAEPTAVTTADTVLQAVPEPAMSDVNSSEADTEADTARQYDPLEEDMSGKDSESDSSTWIYIVILIIAIIAVIALVIYAMNAMKGRDNMRAERDNDAAIEEELEELRNKLARIVAEKNAEIAELENRLHAADRRVRELESRASVPSGGYRGRDVASRPEKEVYLARANSRGIFVRADSSYSVGNSIFRLVTSDGITGTFSVIDDPSVFEVALMMPADYLLTACTGRNLQLSAGMRGIETDSPGTAVFEDGRWRVTRKATIHYTR